MCMPHAHSCSVYLVTVMSHGVFHFPFMMNGVEIHQISYFLLNDSCWKIMSERNYILAERETNLKRILVFYLIAVFFSVSNISI